MANLFLKFRKKFQPTRQRFGLKKLTIGVASVLLGLTFINGTASANENQTIIAGQEESAVAAVTSTEQGSSTTVALTTPASDSNIASTVNDVAESTVASINSTADVTAEISTSTSPINSADIETTSSVSSVAFPAVSESTENNVVASNAATEQTAPTNNSIGTVDIIHNDPLLKDYGIDINYLDAKSTLLLASLFHIFANNANLGADVNGNIAVSTLGGSIDFGTRGDSINLVNGDIYYIQNLTDALNSGSFRNNEFNHVIFGNDIDVQIINDKVYVNGQCMDNLKTHEVFKDGAGTNYIDFEAVFKRLIKASEFYAEKENSAGVIFNVSDMNNRYIDVSKATATDNVIYVNVPAEYLAAPQPLKIYGLSSKVDGPTIVINVTGVSGKELNIRTQICLYYDDDKVEINNGESHAVPNHLLWNFGDLEKIIVDSGRFMGSILAPLATVNAHVNIDGNIVADTVNIIGGESHRWDIHPVFPDDSFIEIPPIDPKPEPEPEPEPEQSVPELTLNNKDTVIQDNKVKKEVATSDSHLINMTQQAENKTNELPQTGNKTENLAVLGLIAAVLGFGILPKKKVK